jgi:hypothetical protein
MDHSVPKTCNAVKNNFLNVFSASPRVCQREDAATTAPQPPATQTVKKGREKARKLDRRIIANVRSTVTPSERRWTRLKAPEKSFHAARETRR